MYGNVLIKLQHYRVKLIWQDTVIFLSDLTNIGKTFREI